MTDQAPLTPPSPGPPPPPGPAAPTPPAGPATAWPGYVASGPAWGESEAHAVPERYLGGPGAAPTHPRATTSLVLGLTGLLGVVATPFLFFSFIAVLASPFAIWLGVSARRDIRAHPRLHSGEGLAVAGLVTGIVGIVLAVLMVLAVVAFAALVLAILADAAG